MSSLHSPGGERCLKHGRFWFVVEVWDSISVRAGFCFNEPSVSESLGKLV